MHFKIVRLLFSVFCLLFVVHAKNFQICGDRMCKQNCTIVPSGECFPYGNKFYLGVFVQDNSWLNFTAFSDPLCSINLTNTPMGGGGCSSFLSKEYGNITVGFTVPSGSPKTMVLNNGFFFLAFALLFANL
ncbi:hypothetical protein BC940DRAFT_295615 [Gongronella butleri]|nr:hypothetical protein BC940DRAFT_295615 [Gongronella butleri]